MVHSWQSGRFQHQRTRVRIQPLAPFIEQFSVVNLTVEKTKIKKKAGNGPLIRVLEWIIPCLFFVYLYHVSIFAQIGNDKSFLEDFSLFGDTDNLNATRTTAQWVSNAAIDAFRATNGLPKCPLRRQFESAATSTR